MPSTGRLDVELIALVRDRLASVLKAYIRDAQSVKDPNHPDHGNWAGDFPDVPRGLEHAQVEHTVDRMSISSKEGDYLVVKLKPVRKGFRLTAPEGETFTATWERGPGHPQ
jgi:hypothetical protein